MEKATALKLETVAVTDDNGSDNIEIFTLHLRNTTVHLSSLGACIIKFLSKIPGKDGDNAEEVDIVAGYKDAKTYHDVGNPPYFNAIVGRVANRIKEGKFSLTSDRNKNKSKSEYSIYTNNPPNCLHGGKVGFSHKLWDGIIHDGSAIQFSLLSPDGDQGFPGSIMVTAKYSLRPSFSLSGVVLQLDMKAKLIVSEKNQQLQQTPINLANHSYFNLGDHKNGILDHKLKLESNSYTPVDETMIPTRLVQSLDDDQVMDFRTERTLRNALKEYGVVKMGLTLQESNDNLTKRSFSSLSIPSYGFDHNYIVRNQPGISVPKVGVVTFGQRNLSVYSNAPGVQIYTANSLGDDENSSSEHICKEAYGPWNAICLETQHFPDSICDKDSKTTSSLAIDKESWGAGKCPILTRTEPTYKHTVVYRFEVDTSNTKYNGSDTNGKNYASIEDMWNNQDLSTWYTRAKNWYEENCSTTIDGVLGGIGHISDMDLNGSRDFLIKKLKLSPMKSESTDNGKKKPSLACECGAGIGRVTAGLLLDFADRCDLVESSSRLLNAAPDHIGDNESHRCRFFCSVLQDWQPGLDKYSIIWIQWTLCYLTDLDIVEFLIRCSESLVEGGWIILKENSCAEEAFVVDVDDASITRSLEYWLDLIAKSGLQLKHLTWQDDFPDYIYPVPMLAIQP
mmetsp:Transcript_51941/g.56262  ORF Transcript_51941/g.56262 Transcript_51941/m.56262 type:complete len:677 (+) Transcript_51941:75-2105(+)